MVGKVHRILVGTDPIFLIPVVFLLSKIKRAPMILDERDLFPETAIALNVIQDGLLAGMLFRMQHFFRKKAISILAATPGIMRRLISYGCPEEKIQILYNAYVYLCEYDLNMPIVSLRKQMNRNFVAGYVGGLGKANDIKTLLRAARHLEEIEDIGIVIIGSGENKTLYKKYCIQNNLKNVFIKGSFPRVETRRLIGEMNVYIHLMKDCSFFECAMSSKVFDYVGLGKPIVFCRSGNIEELLNCSGAGITVKANDDRALAAAIRRLYDDVPLRRKMGRSARSWFEKNVTVDNARSILEKAMMKL
jgi:glycosyltransferase involved in cell wall biosynthesis